MLFRSPAALAALLSLAAFATASAIDLSDATPAGLAARAISSPVKTCKGKGQYPIPINGVCKPCTAKFDLAATCTTSGATKCITGVLSAGKCATTCPASSYLSGTNCLTCSSKFSGAATCTATAATKCATGYLSGGKCLANCPSGFVNSPSTHTCAACSTVTGSNTCSGGKVATCKDPYYLNALKTGCTACTTLDKRAATCTATSVTTCASPFTKSANGKSCILGNTWSYYLASSIPDMKFNAVQTSPIKCGRHSMANANPLAQYDPDSDNCYEGLSVTSDVVKTLVWDADNTVFVYGTCAANNKNVPADAKARCYDAIMTATACTLKSSQQACSVLLNDCDGDQFRNYNGQCQDCQAVYPDALTCDIYNGATSCVDGDYLTEDGVCHDCTQSSVFGSDPNIATCSATAVLTCNYGFAPATDGKSCVATAPGSNGMLSNNWAYYMDSFVSGGTLLLDGTDTITDPVTCAEVAFGQSISLATWDVTYDTDGVTVTGGACYAVARTDALVGAIAAKDGASTYVLGACTDNSAAASDDSNSVCYDVTLTELACNLDDGSNCQ